MLNNNRGLTLLEVILALTILSAFLVGFSYMIGNNALWNKKNEVEHFSLIISHFCMEFSKGTKKVDLQKYDSEGIEIFDDQMLTDIGHFCQEVTFPYSSDEISTIITVNNEDYTLKRKVEGTTNSNDYYELVEIIINEPYQLNSKYLIEK